MKVNKTEKNGITTIGIAFLTSILNPRKNFTFKWAIHMTNCIEMLSANDLLNKDDFDFSSRRYFLIPTSHVAVINMYI